MTGIPYQRYQGVVAPPLIATLAYLGILVRADSTRIAPIAGGDGTVAFDLESLRGLDAHRRAAAELSARMTEIDAEADGKPFNDTQRNEFEAIAGEDGLLAQVNAAIDELEVREKLVAKIVSESGRGVESEATSLRTPSTRKAPENVFDLAAYRQRAASVDDLPALYREGALKVLEQADFPTAENDKARAAVIKLLAKDDKAGTIARRIIATGDPVYQEALTRYAAGGFPAVPPRMQAILQTYSNADGGYAIPFTIDPTFINTSDGVVNPMRQISRVVQITTKSWQALTTEGVTAAYVGERTTTGASDSAPDDVTPKEITPIRADVAIDFTVEYQEDYGDAALRTELGRLIQDAKDVLEADKFLNGSGTGEPEGLVWALDDDGGSVIPTAAAHTFALGDIDALIGALPPRYRSRARFLTSLGILQLVPAFGSAGQPAGSIYDAVTDRLRGYPLSEASEMPATAGDNAEILVFGDFNYFVIVDRVGLSVEYIPMMFDTNGRPTGNRGIYAHWRNSSGLLTPAAFRMLQVKAS